MASIQKSGRNSWRLQVNLGYDVNGKRLYKRKTVCVENAEKMKKLELKRFLDSELSKFKIEVEVGEYISPDKMKFDQFAKEWESKFVMKQLEQTSQENYISIMNNRLIPHFGHMRVDQIQTFHVMNFIESLDKPGARIDGSLKPLSSSSKVYIYRVLRSVFMRAIDWKVIKVSPMVGTVKPKEIKVECEAYDEQETMFIFEALQNERPDFRMIATLALTSGLRRGELLALEWHHIDLEAGTVEVKQSLPRFKNGVPLIKVPKNNSSFRKVALPESVISEFKEYYDYKKAAKDAINDKWQGGVRSFVFCSTFGNAYSQNWPTKQWHYFHAKLNGAIKYIRFHDLRHTSATLLINQGVHAKVISERLGHSNIGTTMNVYGHVLRTADHAAANKLDFLFDSRKNKVNKGQDQGTIEVPKGTIEVPNR
ncbi:Tyrosine recombinase XerC [Paenibacillus allorhizoplanae]|uniref:Tyrosine recombinase XerC n=1 Tax=Paenibacillus allorhizoplanae TaxID=2905648 RepID=A0ABM9C7R0_9BACL|nr:site-specific integrase [Paenibacillus allorhizoplanae]CAH1205308.1 Tyrosine recombinase XerC [Paenibacillus allorhizoplanae]